MSVINSRDSWEPVYSDGCIDIGTDQWTEIFVHHTVTELAEGQIEQEHMREIEQITQDKFGCGISYTIVIFPSGNAFQGNSLSKQGAHTYMHNNSARAICFVGNFEVDYPTPEALASASAVLTEWQSQGYPHVITGGHRDVYNTLCPGQHLYDVLSTITAGGSAPAPPSGGSGMTRTMYDSTNANDIPLDAEMVAGYMDGLYAWSAADWARFPNAVHVHISAIGAVSTQVGDVERGCIWPVEEAVPWVVQARANGYDPTIYVNETNDWQPCKDAFANAGVPEPHWWVANYDGNENYIPDGAVARQYGNPPIVGFHADVSVVADYWPGVDSGTPPTPVEEDDMSAEAERQIGVIHDFLAVSANAPRGQTLHDAVWADGDKVDALAAKVDALTAKLDALGGGVVAGPGGTVTITPEQLAAAVQTALVNIDVNLVRKTTGG